MRKIPIIFVHTGNSFYLKHVLEQARIFNPDSNIYLLGDDSNKKIKGIEHYSMSDFFESAKEFQKIYKHQSSNSYAIELFCFQRWFIVREFIKEKEISHFLYLDSDVLLYCNVDALFNQYLDFDYTICNYSSLGTNLLNEKSINDICNFIYELYTQEDYLNLLENRYVNEFVSKNRLGGNCDMTVFELYHKYKSPKVKDISIIQDDTCFDDNINDPGNFVEDSDGKKQIYWIDNKPYGKLQENQQLILFNSLHFQGSAKHQMYNYRINSRHKHVGGIFYKIKSEFSIGLAIRVIKRFFC